MQNLFVSFFFVNDGRSMRRRFFVSINQDPRFHKIKRHLCYNKKYIEFKFIVGFILHDLRGVVY